MNEQEYDQALLDEIKLRISANLEEIERADSMGHEVAFFDGANTALEELAVQFGLVERFGILVKS